MKATQLLQVRITIVMRRDNYNFFNSLPDFQSRLKKWFNEDYTLDEIEDAMSKLEETFIYTDLSEEIERSMPELPEDETN